MNTTLDTLVVAVLTALTGVGVVVTDMVTGSTPLVLSSAFTLLIGATAGLAVGRGVPTSGSGTG
jgi:hypothetical protein